MNKRTGQKWKAKWNKEQRCYKRTVILDCLKYFSRLHWSTGGFCWGQRGGFRFGQGASGADSADTGGRVCNAVARSPAPRPPRPTRTHWPWPPPSRRPALSPPGPRPSPTPALLPAQTGYQLRSRIPRPDPLPSRPLPPLTAPPGAGLSPSSNPSLRRPSAPGDRGRQQLLRVRVPDAEIISGDMEALGQGPACGIPGGGQHWAAGRPPVLSPGLHSAASRPGQPRNLSSSAGVSARAEGREGSRATSGSSSFKPRSHGFSFPWGETHARASRIQQRRSDPAGQISWAERSRMEHAH